MFKSARLKLTGWYLLIIMTISIFFSGLVYFGISRELEQGFHRAGVLIMANQMGLRPPMINNRQGFFSESELEEILESEEYGLKEGLNNAKLGVVRKLALVNGIILVFSAGAGYLLAGKALEPIEKSLEEQKRFTADASHELRTPLSALKTSMEVALRDKKMSVKDARKIIKDNLESVDELNLLSENLLGMASYQNNGNDLVFERIDFSNLIKRVGEKMKSLAEKKKIKINFDLKKYFVKGDKQSLEKMVYIFLDNAIKYTPKKGKVSVNLKKTGNLLNLEIKDTGIGIGKEDLSHIFDRFYRADQSRSKEKISGFGLGLSLAKKIIELHSGSVNVSSKLGKGTIFTIKFPVYSK